MNDDCPFEPATPRPYYPDADLASMDATQLRVEAERYRVGANHFYRSWVETLASHGIANEALRGVLDALNVPHHDRKISGSPDQYAGTIAYRHFYTLARGR